VAVDREKYKPRLVEYLQYKGVDTSQNPTTCPNAAAHKHGDSKPSFSVFGENASECKCFGCTCGGDIYKMVEFFEGISDFIEQYKFLESFFGNPSYSPPPPKPTWKNDDFKPDGKAMEVFETYLKKNPASEKMIRQFLKNRARYSTGGGTHLREEGDFADYPEDTISFFLENMFYWPGLDIAKRDLANDVFKKCGIPLYGQNREPSEWEHSGVILKLGQGYKLHYYEKKYCDKCKNSEAYRKAIGEGIENNEAAKLLECKKYQPKGFCHKCEKRNSRKGTAFPMPGKIDEALPVILVEGEMDALAASAAGIKNLFSTGGTQGLTKPKAETHLLNVPEIVLMFDGDEKGRMWSGLIPMDGQNIPRKIKQAGFAGKIRLAELPQDEDCNDPDALVIAERRNVLFEAIEGAKEYIPHEIPKKSKFQSFAFFSDLSVKRLKYLLKKVAREKLDASDVQPFISACRKAFSSGETGTLLKQWGASQKEIAAKNDVAPAFLLEVAEKYLSHYMRRVIEKELTPADELLRRIKIQNTKIEIDFEELESNENARNFVLYGGIRSAALVLADIFDDRIIYNDAKNDKHFYFFDDHIWRHEPDITGVIYNALLAVLRHFIKLNRDSDADEETKKKEKGRLMDVLGSIESRTMRVEIKQEFASLKTEGVYHNSDDADDPLRFDGELTRETLTLLDGVMDFSGKELVFRKSRPEEFRSRTLPYKIDDIKKGGPCEKIWQFFRGNFKNADTLETLMYYISIIPSRAFYKYGGFWIGGKNTGKSTTMRIVETIYDYLIVNLDPDIIMSKGKTFPQGNGPTPYLARLPGKGAAFISEPDDGVSLNTGLWKKLTGGDSMSARGLNEALKDFRNSAQIVINTNHLPRFDSHDDAVSVRAVVIPFLVSHEADEEGTMRPEEFVERLRPEFPAFIRLMADYYIKLKYEHKGTLPISKECESAKIGYIAEVETDLDRYVNACVSFEPQSVAVIKNVYESYKLYYEFDENSVKRGEALTQHRFTRLVLKNHKDKITEAVRRIDGKPARCFIGLRLKPMDEVSTRGEAKDVFNNSSQKQTEYEEECPF
jgi:phage/plasmid-associated DNA primase/DNA primase